MPHQDAEVPSEFANIDQDRVDTVALSFGHDSEDDAACNNDQDDQTVKVYKLHNTYTTTGAEELSPSSSETGRHSVNSRQAATEKPFDQSSDKSARRNSNRKSCKGEDTTRWTPWNSWSRSRRRTTAYGLLSSVLVLTIRLLLDHEPTAYLIHSIVIFVDMFLIHVFTNCLWLSVSGELLTIVFALTFHVSKETVWELAETTLIAALCSFHMILSRNKHQDRVAELEEGMKQLKLSSVFLLQNLEVVEDETVQAWEEEAFKLNQSIAAGVAATMTHKLDDDIAPLHVCGEKFFEHFLDGSAGVMYTSFLGLIINELLFYGESKK